MSPYNFLDNQNAPQLNNVGVDESSFTHKGVETRFRQCQY